MTTSVRAPGTECGNSAGPVSTLPALGRPFNDSVIVLALRPVLLRLGDVHRFSPMSVCWMGAGSRASDCFQSYASQSPGWFRAVPVGAAGRRIRALWYQLG